MIPVPAVPPAYHRPAPHAGAAHIGAMYTAFLAVGVAGEMGLAWSLLRGVGGGAARDAR